MSRFEIKGKAPLIKAGQDYWGTLGDTLTFCKLNTVPVRAVKPHIVLDFFNAVTGKNLTMKELLAIGERVYTLCRAYNVRSGASRETDVLAERFADPHTSGGAEGQALTQADLDVMLDEYYPLRGWDPNGIPTRETLENLNLGDIATGLAR
jgi:aldehyde:ferredoxin oxidoreductase